MTGKSSILSSFLGKKPKDAAPLTMLSNLATGLLALDNNPRALVDGFGAIIGANKAFTKAFGSGGLDAILKKLAGNQSAFGAMGAISQGAAHDIKTDKWAIQISPLTDAGPGHGELFLAVNFVDKAMVAAPILADGAADNNGPIQVAPQTVTAKAATKDPKGADPSTGNAMSANLANANPSNLKVGSAIGLAAGRRAALIDAAPIGIATLGPGGGINGKIISANQAFVRIVGGGKDAKLTDLIIAENYADLANLKPGDKDPIMVTLSRHKNRQVEIWLIDDKSEGGSILVQDVTAKHQMEASLTQGSKLEVLGQVAATVAHDLNNTLNVISAAKDILLTRHPLGDPSYPRLVDISDSVGRGSEMVRQLLNYSRRQTVRRSLIDVSQVISAFQSFVVRMVGQYADVDVRHGRNVPDVLMDTQQLEGLVMNLATNARDAIKSKNEGIGKITIATRCAQSSEVATALAGSGASFVPQCTWAVIEVTDTGTGIPDEIKEDIFKPFFTTKERGEGTGIGMGAIYGIVKKANGFIVLDTKVGQGTSFTVFLPDAASQASQEELNEFAQEAEANEEKQANAAEVKHADLSGRGRILFAEDEASLRRMISEQFRALGYEVVDAEDGEVALELLMEEPASFDVIITDVKMPVMEGPEFLEQGRDHLGDAHIIITSGFAEADLSAFLEKDRAVAFITKPYRFVDLVQAVKDLQNKKNKL